MSLRTKVLLPLVFFGIILTGYLYGYWMPQALESLRVEHQDATERHLDSVIEGLIPLLLGHQLDTIYENLDALRAKNREWVGIELNDAQGKSIYPLSSVPLPAVKAPGEEAQVLKRRIEYLGTNLGVLAVRVDFAPWLAQAENRQRQLVVVVLIVIVAFFASAAYVLERLVVKPVNALSRAASELARNNFDVQLAKNGDDEVGNLVNRFAEMREAIRGYQMELLERSEVLKRSEEELEQRVADRTAQLESANKELESFAYSVSHDLRAPLRHIDGFLGLLEEKIEPTLDEESRHYITTISDAARRMGTLIDDLLSFSRMGRNEMAKTRVDLSALVQEAIREFEPETQGRVVDWRIAELPVVAGDRAMLRVVLVNLISNALKFTRPRARAEIAIGCLPDHEAETILFVRDNGVGFDMQYVDKLFGVFQRLHGADEFEGTGIGLANVRRIITRHGGKVWAEGKVDGGATFYFSLPRSSDEEVMGETL